MKHTKQTQLIQYQFKLLSGNKLQQVEEHLADCDLCRKELERIQQKYAPLELLREDVTASEELISQTLANIGPKIAHSVSEVGQKSQVSSEVLRKSYLFGPRGRWAAAASVMILIGGMFIIAQFLGPDTTKTTHKPNGSGTPQDGDYVELPKPSKETGDKGKGAEELLVANGVGVSRPDPESVTAMIITPDSDNVLTPFGAKEEEGEKAPFAPASNIELVVLPRRDKVQLTIYNSADLTLVREERNLTMKKGWNWLQFQWANTKIDPTSLSLEPKQQRDQIWVEQLVFPPRLKDLGRWLIKSKVSGQVPFEITYLTSGLSWRAFYMGTMTPDEKTMRLQGYVRAANQSGDDYEDAQTRLIVGKVHLLDTIADLAKRDYPFGRPGVGPVDHSGRLGQWADMNGDDKLATWSIGHSFYAYDAFGELGGLRRKEVVKEGLSEYFLYTIEGTETIPNGYAKRLPSFEEEEVPVVNLYKYEQERYGNNVVRFLSFENDEEHKLGDTPIPGGVLKMYRTADADGYLAYAGQSEFKYIPVNEEVELNLGAVQNVVVEPKLMAYRTKDYEFDAEGDISSWKEMQTYQMEVKNTRALPIQVKVRRNIASTQWELEASRAYEKIDVDTVEFVLDLEPRTQAQFTYTVTIPHELSEAERKGQVSRWSFDEGQGNQIRDAVHGNHGVVHGATWTTGRNGQALYFDGQDDYVDCGNDASLNLSEGITVSAWIYPESNRWGGILSKGDNTANHDDFGLWFNEGKVEFSFNYPERWNFFPEGDRFLGERQAPLQAWSHFAGTWDGQRVRLYVNGEPDKEYPFTTGIRPTGARLYLGSNPVGGQEYFHGRIDEVAIYNRALSPEEIRKLFKNIGQR